MPRCRHYCSCPFHCRGRPCPSCDGPEFRPWATEEWDHLPGVAADAAAVTERYCPATDRRDDPGSA